MDGTHDEVSTGVEDGVLTITWERGAKKNALTTAMYARTVEALRGADEDPAVRAVVITGEGNTFTSGNDLADFMANPAFEESSPVLQFLFALADAKKPLLAAVNGPAIGVGTTMLLHCDLVYAAESARFRLPFVDLGLVPEAASSILLPRVVGTLRASELLLMGEPFDARAALEMGLVNQVVPDADLRARVRERAAFLAKKPPEALAAARRLLRDPHRAGVHDAIRREAAVFMERLGSDEVRQAIETFFQKRGK